MKQIVPLVLVTALLANPVNAQEDNDISEGMELLQQGSRLLFDGILKELGPALEELEGKVLDLNKYHAPEILPNGDIIIRRKIPLDTDPAEGEEIEL